MYYASELPSNFLDRLAQELNISPEYLCEITDIDVPTLKKRKTEGTFTKEESDRILKIQKLFDLAKKAFYTHEQGVSWLTTPQLKLDNQVPLAIVKTEIGHQKVEKLLGQIYDRMMFSS